MSDSTMVAERVKDVAVEARQQLHAGRVVLIALEPGNATRYELVLTPLANAFERLSLTPVGAGVQRDYAVAVSLVNYGTSVVLPVLDPMEYFAPAYVQDKLGCTGGDAEVLAALLNTIATDV